MPACAEGIGLQSVFHWDGIASAPIDEAVGSDRIDSMCFVTIAPLPSRVTSLPRSRALCRISPFSTRSWSARTARQRQDAAIDDVLPMDACNALCGQNFSIQKFRGAGAAARAIPGRGPAMTVCPVARRAAQGRSRQAGRTEHSHPPHASGSATNLTASRDFTRISTVCLPALRNSARSLRMSAGVETSLPATSRIRSPI